MAVQLNETDARANFGDVLGQVCRDQIPVVIEREGKPVAVLISPEQWEDFQQLLKERMFEAVDRLQKLNEDTDPDEVERVVTEEVEEVRRERYERRQQQARRGA
jgi:prevent-host-death family protein